MVDFYSIEYLNWMPQHCVALSLLVKTDHKLKLYGLQTMEKKIQMQKNMYQFNSCEICEFTDVKSNHFQLF